MSLPTSTYRPQAWPRPQWLISSSRCDKTVVPDTFRVLFSQRRRWINSTIHSLAAARAHHRHEPQDRVRGLDAHLPHLAPDLERAAAAYAFWHF
ncbi:hypothetical protein C8J57DRAFT_1288135, partial [Mycena rebaudengoi]